MQAAIIPVLLLIAAASVLVSLNLARALRSRRRTQRRLQELRRLRP